MTDKGKDPDQSTVERYMEQLETALKPMHDLFQSEAWQNIRKIVAEAKDNPPEWLELMREAMSLDLIMNTIVKSDATYNARDWIALLDMARQSDGTVDPSSQFMQVLKTARLSAQQTIEPVNPRNHIAVNNVLMNSLQAQPIIDGKPVNLRVAKMAAEKPITIYVIVNFDPEDTGLTFTGNRISEFDRQVADAIITLWVTAKEEELPPVFTINTIHRAMIGGSENPTPVHSALIEESVEKLRRLHVKLNATNELRYRGLLSDDAVFELDDFFLTARKGRGRTKHGTKAVSAYFVHSEPIILEYARKTKQLITIPAENLNIRKLDSKGDLTNQTVSMNKERQVLTGYVLRRIAIMKNERERQESKRKALEKKGIRITYKQKPTILFSEAFDTVGIQSPDKVQAKRYRDFVFQVLDYQVAIGYIPAYEKVTKGRSITGVKILFENG